VRAGGYRRPELWKYPFVIAGREVPFEEAMALFRDRTGRPGPSTWELGSFPEGQAEFPRIGRELVRSGSLGRIRRQEPPDGAPLVPRAADLGPFSDLLRSSNFGGRGPGEVGKALQPQRLRHL
jgi:hypothetical protein